MIVPLVTIIGARTMRELGTGGLGAVMWLWDLLLVAGWFIGYIILAEADHIFYALMCNPHELTCSRVRAEVDKKNWKLAWRMLQETKPERNRLPIRNMLSVIVLAGLGLWVVSSSGSGLAVGAVLGLGVRLFKEALVEPDYKRWYWIFAREFSPQEHRGLMLAWGAALGLQLIMLLGQN